MSKKFYILATLLVFTVELCIAIWASPGFIRGFLGDVLAVIFLYTLLRTITAWGLESSALISIVFAFSLEFFQLWNGFTHKGPRYLWLETLLGTTFDPWDLLAYLIGFCCIYLLENYASRRFKKETA